MLALANREWKDNQNYAKVLLARQDALDAQTEN